MSFRSGIAVLPALLASLALAGAVTAAPPPGFVNEVLVGGFVDPMSVGFLPDGRVLVLERDGDILVADPSDNPVVSAPYMVIPDVLSTQQNGAVDITLDPDFLTNGYFYVYYTHAPSGLARIARFTHSVSFADPASEFVVWQDNQANIANGHIGGGLDFGPDGLLYLTTGDKQVGPNAQDLTSSSGKVIRVQSDGGVPAGNPYIDGAGPQVDFIWARGLRNPTRARWDLVDNRLYIADVGQDTLEEVHIGASAANYGWDVCEGFCGDPQYDDPLFTYPHDVVGGAVIGGYVNRNSGFPSPYNGVYFYADYVQGWIRYAEFDGLGNVTSTQDFDPNVGVFSVNFLDGAPDGSLYYIEYDTGNVRRVSYPGATTFADDFDRAALGSNWQIANGNFEIQTNQLVQTSGLSYIDAQLDWLGGTTKTPDQFAKLQIVNPNSHTFGFMFRRGDATGLHYEVHLPQGSSQWRWEANDPGFVERVGDCVGIAPVANGNWIGARVEGVGSATVVSVWRWAADPGALSNWGVPDCEMFQDPTTAADAGKGVGIRAYTGQSTSLGSADSWQAGDLTPPGVCGNSILEPGEDCDDGGPSIGCDADCSFAACGDGNFNPIAEQCESDIDCGGSDVCSGSCSCVPAPVCGDGVVDLGEDCDDSGASATCDADCTFATCGDGTFNPAAEQCEADLDCSVGDICTASCACVIEPICGNAITEPGEDCDDGGESSTCNADCTFAACGDLVLNPTAGEICEIDAQCGVGEACGGCACGPPEQAFSDNFDRASLGSDWVIDSGNYSIVANQLVENSGTRYIDAQLRYVAGTTTFPDQYAKLQIVTQNSHTLGFMFRTGDPSGMHYEVHSPQGGSEWRWELYDPDFVERVGNCQGDQTVSNGDWVGAQVIGGATGTQVSVWRWDSDPGDVTSWGAPDCLMTQDPSTAVDAGLGLGIRAYTGNQTNNGVADNWSAGDVILPGVCGDLVLDPGEECDDGGASAFCDADCSFAACGDGVFNPAAEQCESDNDCSVGDFCDGGCACVLLPICGNSIPEAGEDCDEGGATATCDADCTLPMCGDGTFNPSAEQCEVDGDCTGGDICDGSCACGPAPVCGDGIIDTGEDCDDMGASATCDTDCTFAVCNDGIFNPAAEQCEVDGDCLGGDICDNSCACVVPPVCGNGIVEFGEDCDDSGESGSCDADCSFAVCGDLVLNPTAGEQCEVNADCSVGETCQSCGCGSAMALFSDDFDRASLGPDWTIDSGNYAILSNQLTENSGSSYVDAQLRFTGGQTASVNQFSLLQVVSQATHTFGFMFRTGDPSGAHYEIHLPNATSEWRWELYNPNYVDRVGQCQGDRVLLPGDFIGARVDGVGDDTEVSVWRWNTNPGNDTTTWGIPDCQMFQNPSTAVDQGQGLGIRSYTGGQSTSANADLWSGGDGQGAVEPPVTNPTIVHILGPNGAGTPNSLQDPDGVVVDSAGNVFVGACGFGPQDEGVFKIEPDLSITKVMGGDGDGVNPATCMVGLDVDPAGNVYGAAFMSDNVFVITPSGTITEIMNSSGAGTPNSLIGPIDVAVDSVGNVYAAGFFSDRVFKRTPGGVITEVLGPNGDNVATNLAAPFGLAIDSNDNLYVPGFGVGSDAVFRVTPAGTISVILDESGDGGAHALTAPHAIAVDAQDNVFITGNMSDNVFKVTQSGTISVILDSSGDGAGNPMDNPTGIATDLSGNVFVNAFGSDNTFKITPAGVVTEILDITGDGSHAFVEPADVGICTDAAGNVYTAGTAADNVFKILPTR